MPGRDRFAACKIVLALCVVLLGADRALAYVGPGADVAFVSYAMTLLLWVLAAFSAVLLWPVYALLRWVRGPRAEDAAPLSEAAPENARAHSHPES